MDATFTNLSASPIYIPGPNIELAAAGDPDGNHIKVWPNILIADLDANTTVKNAVLAGTMSVSVVPGTEDAAAAVRGTLNISSPERCTVAQLPTGYNGRVAFATNGRKTSGVPEGVGAGTGVLVCFSNAAWRLVSDDSVVAA